MKQRYLIIAAAVSMLAACSQNEKLNQDLKDTQKAALSFSAYSDVITRATDAKNSTNLKDFHDAFAVYGWKTVGTTTQNVFNNIPNEYFTAKDGHGTNVYPTGGDLTPEDEWAVPADISAEKGYWYYQDVRYWDKLATYQFFAIAPYNATPYYTVAAGNDNFSLYKNEDGKRYDISNEKNLMASKPEKNLKYYRFDNDFMIAEKKTTENIAATATASQADVTLVFHHILSKLNVMIQKDPEFKGKQNLAVTDLVIANLAKEGSFVYTTDMTTNGWTTTGTYNISLTGKDYSLNTATAANNYDQCYWVENLIFPQNITCKKAYVNNAIVPQADATGLVSYLYIKYTIGDEIFEAYYDLANVFGVKTVDTNYPFAQGSQYRLTITVGPKPIHFAAQVTQWAEANDPAANLDAN